MNIKPLYYLLLALSSSVFSQTITIDNVTNTPAQLVDLLLVNSCVSVSNITISSNQSVAYFNRNGSTFSINEGIIIRNGLALNTQGNYSNNATLSSQINTNTDVYLQNISNNSGQSSTITDVAFLEFDFIPVSNSFSFDFLFASNEYGEYQCGFSDVFAFVLTNLNTGVSTNLAVIPGTNMPVTVKDIRNNLYNANCESANSNFFSTYNPTNIPASTLNMRGHTVVMNAASAVIPNVPYKIRLVIGDYNDSGYDSAVFISGGSFTTSLDLGPDQTICSGNPIQLNTQLDNTYTYQWFQNGNPVGGNTPSYTVNIPGTYSVEVTKGSCFLADTVIVNNLAVSNPINLQTCNTGAASYTFDLTTNNENQLGINNATYDLIYYASMADITANNPIVGPTNFSTTSGQTIYVKIYNTISNSFCDAVYQFDLVINPVVNATQPSDVQLCEAPASTTYFLANLDLQVLNGLTGYSVLYFSNQADAIAGNTGAITLVTIPNGTSTITVWIRLQNNANPSCFDVTSVDINVNPLPLVDELADVVACSNYVLLALTNGNYFTGPGGTGTALFAGNTIDLGTTYYIYNGPDANGCFNETSFLAYFVDEYRPQLDNCGSFVIPSPPYNIGAFYTAPGGPMGTGTLIPTGTVFSNTSQSNIVQPIYYYAEVNGVFCRDELFNINIHPLPLVDDLPDVTYCSSYTLLPLTNGNYFSQPGGNGTPYFAGNTISTTQIMYIYNTTSYIDANGNPGGCPLETDFQINIINTVLFTTINRCASFTLPAITFGGYYTAPLGGGLPIDPNVPITTSQVVYFYANTTLLPNCSDNLNYNIIINPRPLVDVITSRVYCGEFILPVLTNGSYYTLPGGPTTLGQIPVFAGNSIDLSGVRLNPGTYYVFNGPDVNGCTNEQPFTINLNPFPPADGVLDRFECRPYTIAQPVNGTIYTAPGGPSGGGTLVSSSTVFSTTQTFYLYNINTVTDCKINRPFTVTYSGINLPDYSNVSVCESQNYTLPALTHLPPTPVNYTIGYFYDQAGTLPVPNGLVFNVPNTTTTIWVVASNGDRTICNAQDSFDIIVSQTPNLAALALVFDTEECVTYILPALPSVGFNLNYYSQPGGNIANLITNLNITTPGRFTYYVYASAFNNPNCNAEQAFTFTIHPLLNITLPQGVICVDPITNTLIRPYTIQTGLNPAVFTANWFLNGTLLGTGPNFTATQAGVYNVTFVKLTPDVGSACNYNNTTVTIIQSSPAKANFTVSPEFNTDGTFITVNITEGYGNYTYQLEYPNGALSPIQTSNTFTNLATGDYFVIIYDTLGNCTPTRIGPIYIINYPNYFTPNGDGFHDTWNIFDLAQQPKSLISIFDRYGKLLRQISPAGSGWDGKYDGKDLPSTDYWFSVEFMTQSKQKAIFKSHFSLKR
ncbi:choice-of-anchor L domain-containing protein [Flavobacterium sp.]|jgi:gliding motility-associated-like protein|uniref:choice-of-anchor L domain-containing protein n=1 Tax=Flavobacterium sp. TaxID=239 RepID=UPI0037C000E2